VMNPIVFQRPGQWRGDVLLTDHVGQSRWPVGAVQRQGHAPTLMPDSDDSIRVAANDGYHAH